MHLNQPRSETQTRLQRPEIVQVHLPQGAQTEGALLAADSVVRLRHVVPVHQALTPNDETVAKRDEWRTYVRGQAAPLGGLQDRLECVQEPRVRLSTSSPADQHAMF